MKILKVPYAEKDEAKALGARWNSARKAWYVPDGTDERPFARWFAAGGDAPAAGAASGKDASKDSYSGVPVTGKYFIELEHDCDPFAICAICSPKLAESGWLEANNTVRKMLGALGR